MSYTCSYAPSRTVITFNGNESIEKAKLAAEILQKKAEDTPNDTLCIGVNNADTDKFSVTLTAIDSDALYNYSEEFKRIYDSVKL